MGMTRRDYIKLAAALHKSRPLTVGEPPEHAVHTRAQWDCTVHTIADSLADDNPRFDRSRFVKACEEGADDD